MTFPPPSMHGLPPHGAPAGPPQPPAPPPGLPQQGPPPQGSPLPGHRLDAGSGAPTAYLPRQGAPQGPPAGPPPGAPGAPGAPHPGPHGAPHAAPAQPPMSRLQLAVTLFAVASVAGVALGISVPEDGHNAWHSVKAWGGVALVAAVLTLAPALGSALRLSAYRAWQIAAGGAAGLGLYWVLFVLPDISKNTSLITTLGVAAGIVVAWIAPGRQPGDGPAGAHSAGRQTGPSW